MSVGLVSGLVQLGTEIAKLIGNKEVMAHVNNLRAIELSILSERQRGYDSDDELIEELYQKREIELNALANQVAVYNASRPH